jgi:arylsulfatase A-like enzyme
MKVVFLMTDTFRRDFIGAYGNRWIRTPNLDRLASMSHVFDSAYVGSFPTLPNRRDMFLGHGMDGTKFNQWTAIERGEITLAGRLTDKGVPAMLITDTANSINRGMNFQEGFPAFYVNRGQEGDPLWTDDGVPLEFPVEPEMLRYSPERWRQILSNRAHRKFEDDWFAPGTYKKACEWLERNYTRKDFFLWVETFDPHEPWDPPLWYERMYDPDYRGPDRSGTVYGDTKKLGIPPRQVRNIRAKYAGECTMVDNAVGRVMHTIEKLGIMDDTAVFF